MGVTKTDGLREKAGGQVCGCYTAKLTGPTGFTGSTGCSPPASLEARSSQRKTSFHFSR